MEDERDYHSHSPSLKHKLRSTLCLSCCFGNRHHGQFEDEDKPRLIRASSTWLKSRAHEFPEFKEKCRNVISRMGKGRRHSADFRYDPLSYALNFDDGSDHIQNDEFPLRNLSSKLPTPPPAKSISQTVVVGEITAC
ncbi:hypothetical protein NE237_030419 [Protea cynaroides]|uniref:Uncharacterized protein n=1 Tax=Protea cynaroides TaxID=273540 RepID=A0A9Q0GT02_9MAGN|nr:hypothetical protein NE237_030419 [Protea cynaroides]